MAPLRPRTVRLLLSAILLAAAVLDFFALDHGRPLGIDRTVDAVHPISSLDLLHRQFGARTQTETKYPRLHFLITNAVYRTWLRATLGAGQTEQFEKALLDRAMAVQSGSFDVTTREPLGEQVGELIVVGRAVSAVFGVLVVLALFLLTRELLGAGAGLAAAALAAVNYPLVYYSHQLNLDVPYLAWGFFALWCLARAVRRGAVASLVAAGLLATGAIATKDQAYALFLLTVPLALWLWMRPGELAAGAADRRAFPWRAALVVIVLGGSLYLILPGWPIDFAWHRDRLTFIATEGSEPFRSEDKSLAGQLSLLAITARHVLDGVGAGGLALALVGLIVTARRSSRAFALLVAPAVSAYVSFIAVIGYVYSRFTIQLQLVLIAAAGGAVAWGLARPRLRIATLIVFAAVLVLAARSVITMERLLNSPDPRLAAESFLRERYSPGTTMLGMIETPAVNVILPPWPGVRSFSSTSAPELTASAPPDVLVISWWDTHIPRGGKGLEQGEEVMTRFGRTYRRVAHFAPAIDHPILVGACVQPRVLIYEAGRAR